MSNPSAPLLGRLPVAAATAGDPGTAYLPNVCDNTVVATRAWFSSDANITANDTNFATIAIKVGATTLGSITTETSGSGGTGNITAGTPVEIELTSPEASVVAVGAAVTVAVTKDGSGVAVLGHVGVGVREVRV